MRSQPPGSSCWGVSTGRVVTAGHAGQRQATPDGHDDVGLSLAGEWWLSDVATGYRVAGETGGRGIYTRAEV